MEMTPKNILKQSLLQDRAAHSHLFYGPDIADQLETARWFAKALNCPAFLKEKEICNCCMSCQKIERGVHPDVHFWLPQGALRSIRMDQVRELQRQASLKPFEGKVKVHILQEAESLHVTAANALLKILEEPPPYTFFILLTRYPEAIISTILSRCQMLSFKVQSQAFDLGQFAECEGDPVFLEALKELACGSVHRAKDLIETGAWEKQKSILKTFYRGLEGSRISIFGESENIAHAIESELEDLEDKIRSGEEVLDDPSINKRREEERKAFMASERSRILKEFLCSVLAGSRGKCQNENELSKFLLYGDAVEEARRFLERGAGLKWVIEALFLKLRVDF